MSHFVTDQQTLNDLNLFGSQGASIHGLFNRTATIKGAALLEELLRYPLADADAINQRSKVIRQFATHKTAFPFRAELFDVAEHYLANTDERSRLSGREKGWGNRLSNLMAEDNEYKNLYKGITALLEIVQSLHTWVDGVGKEQNNSREIAALLASEDWQLVLHLPYKKNIPYQQVVQLDAFLRFRHRAQLHQLLQYIYRLDAYIAIAAVANEKQWVFATALPASPLRIDIADVKHPALPQAIPNSVHITAHNNVIFLTGANMAGKSTLMKTLGTVLFLAHAGFPVPVREMQFSVLDGIYTTINLPDNLGMGASHFYAEVLRVKKVARELSRGKKLLIIFDELFRGTNVKDAWEATVALTRAFAQKKESVFIVSTHIIEAGEELKPQCSNLQFVYMPTTMQGDRPVYTYQLQSGITSDRHGMVIIRNEGLLDMLQSSPFKRTAP
jgi:DNA mismatch repair ATPase MutS